jgi:hypothetical protein
VFLAAGLPLSFFAGLRSRLSSIHDAKWVNATASYCKSL